jgi:hypothetical protein
LTPARSRTVGNGGDPVHVHVAVKVHDHVKVNVNVNDHVGAPGGTGSALARRPEIVYPYLRSWGD